MATIDEYRNRNGKMFRARVRRNGQTFTQVFSTRAAAKIWSKAQEGLVLAGRATPNITKPAHTLGEAFDRYCQDILPRKKPSTRRPQYYQVTRLLTLLGADTRLVDITPARIRALITELEKSGAAPATIVRYLALLSHLFTTAMKEWEWVSVNPVKLVTKPKEPRGRERYLSSEEIQRLLEACQQSRNRSLYTMVFCALSTGARLGELRSLRCQDTDLQRCVVTFRNTKNSDTRCVPLTTAAVAVVQDYERTIGFAGEYVFPQKSIRKAWRTAVTRAGLGRDVVFHTTRHTCGSHLAMSGASLLDIATVLGHHSMSMVRRYSHLSQGHLAEVVEKMTQRLF